MSTRKETSDKLVVPQVGTDLGSVANPYHLFFAGNTRVVMGYQTPSEGYVSAREIDPPIITAVSTRKGKIGAIRSNVPIFGAVYLKKLMVENHTIYEVRRPENFWGFAGIDIAHPQREMRGVPGFEVEDGWTVVAELDYTGLCFPSTPLEYEYSLSLEWIYSTDIL
jgi:hypothetical protein